MTHQTGLMAKSLTAIATLVMVETKMHLSITSRRWRKLISIDKPEEQPLYQNEADKMYFNTFPQSSGHTKIFNYQADIQAKGRLLKFQNFMAPF